ncbi:MAG: glycosyltransferase [Flavobacteriales bacterium]|nr:glycosyltransferase [Flavobacteriales bacterium]|tara:strand:+ start:2620 stop:3576 length:957 start_codon:yes stop_codon:yes gene_type:complete
MDLLLVVPCYFEEEILPHSIQEFESYFLKLKSRGLISENSQICLVDDGSKDKTWEIIEKASANSLFCGLKLSRNCGHQNAVLAGLLSNVNQYDCFITIDADLQDDLNAIENMLLKRKEGFEVVYGVRNNRETDSFFKRHSAQLFYKLLNSFGVDAVYNHADYRLMDNKIIQALEGYKETNLFIRGIIPTIGYKSTIVEYKRAERLAGETKYTLKKMLSFAWDGITSFSHYPLKLIMNLGIVLFILSLSIGGWSFYQYLNGNIVPGWTSTFLTIMGFGGIQMISIGVLGEYIGKIYLEVKNRPRFIVEKTINNLNASNE